jgi:hypothetical protein
MTARAVLPERRLVQKSGFLLDLTIFGQPRIRAHPCESYSILGCHTLEVGHGILPLRPIRTVPPPAADAREMGLGSVAQGNGQSP